MKKPMKLLSLVFVLLCILTSANSYAEEVERSRYSQYKQAESDRTVWFSIPHELGIQPFWVRHYSRYEEVYKIGSQNMESGVRSAFSYIKDWTGWGFSSIDLVKHNKVRYYSGSAQIDENAMLQNEHIWIDSTWLDHYSIVSTENVTFEKGTVYGKVIFGVFCEGALYGDSNVTLSIKISS